ncbi:Sec-independent protein translocase protein TatB [Halomonas sp. 18H]|uniref:Sec-independent protein translocase protein TatB n=1 Tax=Halomonas almeriensis TaxID=308163 RepID=UPI002230E08D|nr:MULTISPECIES: Sec-independent protein translocase protein TatB [Halomonas]MCW4149712.1 Sec-independent protein translocase protein TatB [Halomonas sp. 18H]MDN3553343.1 Sec-independent protein translocase protein TatB [Halomonas almeriensis]
MFDIGFLELLIIGVVGLLVLGPERLPRAARTAGLWVGRLKRTVSDMQREINSQLDAEDWRRQLDEQQKALDEGVNNVRRGARDLADTSRNTGPDDPTATSHDTSAAEADKDTHPR